MLLCCGRLAVSLEYTNPEVVAQQSRVRRVGQEDVELG